MRWVCTLLNPAIECTWIAHNDLETRMAAKTKRRPVILEPLNPPDSFDRAEMRKWIKELADARRRRKKRPAAPTDGK